MKSVIPIPRMMRELPVDPRGYPIPDGVFRDAEGKAHFAINDERRRRWHMAQKRCPICAAKLGRGIWFVGGPRSALAEHGVYIDLPMHGECAHYALKTCPYLAAPHYGGRLDDRTLKGEGERSMIMIDQSMLPDRPALFVAVLARGYEILQEGRFVRPERPYIRVEYWRHGQRLADPEGEALVAEILATPLPEKQPEKIWLRKA